MSIKDKLGISRCCPVDGSTDTDHCSNKDYWAGAVKQCGGVKNMPTMEMLAALASQMYRKDNGTEANPRYSSITIQPYKSYAFNSSDYESHPAWEYYEGYSFNSSSSAAKMIGLSPWFALWSGRETSATHADDRNFGPASTLYKGNPWRGNSGRHGVCLGG